MDDKIVTTSNANAMPTAAETGRDIGEGADPREIVEEVLAKRASADDAIFITLTAERARRDAEAAYSRQQDNARLGPLDGVPIAWKDLIDIEGYITTCGSGTLIDSEPAPQDAVCLRHAAAAGIVSIGKTNLSEFAFSGLGINATFGTPANPHSKTVKRVPGGSSSGSAVAVAAGLVPAAIGTDTGGSVRIPAAFNGLVGLKPSAGRISLAGIAPLAQSFDTVGPLAHTVEDCLLLEATLGGNRPRVVRPAKPEELTFLVPENYACEKLTPDVAATWQNSLQQLEAAGCHIERRHCHFYEAYGELFPEHGMLTASEALNNWKHVVYGPGANLLDPRIRDRMLTGSGIEGRIEEAHANRAKLVAAFEQALGDRFLLVPTTIHVAPAVAPLDADAELYRKVNMRTLRNTMPGNYLCTCGISIPNGYGEDDMPTAVLLNGPDGADLRLHTAALTVEAIVQPQ